MKEPFDLIQRPKVGQRGINAKRYNMVNATETTGVVQYALALVPNVTFNIAAYNDYVLTGIYKSFTQKNRAGVVTPITDVRLNLLNVQRTELPDDFTINNILLQLQFYDNAYIPLRLQVLQDFQIEIFALQDGNFQAGDIVDATIITEFEYIGV